MHLFNGRGKQVKDTWTNAIEVIVGETFHIYDVHNMQVETFRNKQFWNKFQLLSPDAGGSLKKETRLGREQKQSM